MLPTYVRLGSLKLSILKIAIQFCWQSWKLDKTWLSSKVLYRFCDTYPTFFKVMLKACITDIIMCIMPYFLRHEFKYSLMWHVISLNGGLLHPEILTLKLRAINAPQITLTMKRRSKIQGGLIKSAWLPNNVGGTSHDFGIFLWRLDSFVYCIPFMFSMRGG